MCVENVVLQPSEETCGLADQKKKKRQNVIHLSEAVSLPNELYFYEGKHSDSNTCFIIDRNQFRFQMNYILRRETFRLKYMF